MVITVNREAERVRGDVPQEGRHLEPDGARIRPSIPAFELSTTDLLRRCHPSLASQFTVGKPQEEVCVFLDTEVEVKRVVLAVFEGLEPVDDDRVRR